MGKPQAHSGQNESSMFGNSNTGRQNFGQLQQQGNRGGATFSTGQPSNALPPGFAQAGGFSQAPMF